jgi:hypothetical protein
MVGWIVAYLRAFARKLFSNTEGRHRHRLSGKVALVPRYRCISPEYKSIRCTVSTTQHDYSTGIACDFCLGSDKFVSQPELWPFWTKIHGTSLSPKGRTPRWYFCRFTIASCQLTILDVSVTTLPFEATFIAAYCVVNCINKCVLY